MDSANTTTSYTQPQLHGRACILCGAEKGPFLPAGYVTTQGSEGLLPWAVVACLKCPKGSSSE